MKFDSCYRWISPALRGRWRVSYDEAMDDAVRCGQAKAVKGSAIEPRSFVRIEEVAKRSCPLCSGDASLAAGGSRGAGPA